MVRPTKLPTDDVEANAATNENAAENKFKLDINYILKFCDENYFILGAIFAILMALAFPGKFRLMIF